MEQKVYTFCFNFLPQGLHLLPHKVIVYHVRRVIVNKNQASRSEYEAKKEVAATIEDEDEEDKEIMEVLGAEEVDTELDYEVDSEVTKKERKANI